MSLVTLTQDVRLESRWIFTVLVALRQRLVRVLCVSWYLGVATDNKLSHSAAE
ncbi:hypothetical protein [Xylella fastidiosa]|uniref:hypothetical protein n=1 Tax=Xylella fastidiosa TaxID=2371 RepID=UPI0002EF71EC|nr:hypothetical protein [Xylella fastidiosa]MBE0265636.1 hypothetical protein [Xylella fastidiosa subsp. fastidiosa]MBE0285679.1 hypothetical protein [Xylella fastidiosa subsp. fastidiosa]